MRSTGSSIYTTSLTSGPAISTVNGGNLSMARFPRSEEHGEPVNNTSFELHHPTRIVFGAGTRHRIGDLVAPLGTTVALLPGDAPSLEPLLREIVADLARAEVTVVPVQPVASNPRINETNRWAAAIRGRGVQGVVAFGGGSTMDAGKALAVMLSAGIDDLAPLSTRAGKSSGTGFCYVFAYHVGNRTKLAGDDPHRRKRAR